MLENQDETDRNGATRRRCHSLDSLPCCSSDTVLWIVDDSSGVCDHVTGLRRTSDRQQADGGNSETGRCLSTSDLLTAGDAQCCQQGDDYDPSWCSVNNLETDCVSPRVSSNSLFSQLDAGTGTSSDDVGDHPPSSSSYRLTAADVAAAAAGGRWTPCGLGDDQPLYTRHPRRIPPQATARPHVTVPTTSLLRQLTSVAGGGQLRPDAIGYDERRSSMAATNRSASCPSLLYNHCSVSRQQANPVCNIPSKTAEHGVSCEEEHTSRNQERAMDRMADGILEPVSIIAHSTGSGSRSPMVWLTARPSRYASPPTGQDTSVLDGGVSRQVDEGGRKIRQRGVGSSSTMTAGRATRRLARTKCLQWLNSFDEDD